MTPHEVVADQRVQLLDVREPHEWAAVRAPGATHVPMGQVPARTAELDPDRPVAVICRSGNRSAQVVRFLRGAGFDARDVEGGLQQWERSGLPLVTTPVP